MKASTERFIPHEAETADELAIALLHLYAYETVAKLLKVGDRVLELGFGEGYGAAILADTGVEYLGLELDRELIEPARERYGLAFDGYDGTAIPSVDHAFDFVISFQVIEHIPDPIPWLVEIHRVLKPTGMGIVTTPNRVYRVGDGERPWNRHHVCEFTTTELHDLLGRQFPEVSIYGIRGPDHIEAIVRARATRARKLARLDRLGLRYRLPEGFDTRVRRALRRARQPEVDRRRFDVDALWHEQPADAGLDLLAFVQPE